MPVRVKICGITNGADALAAERFGADALGFVFHPDSPRAISPGDARAICGRLSPFVGRVGVFVNRDEAFITETVYRCGLSAVQLSGDEPVDFLTGAPFPVVRVVRMRRREDLRRLAAYPAGTTFVLDTFAPGSYGGTGYTHSFDLSLSPGTTLDSTLRAVIAHGHFHSWNGEIIAPEAFEALTYWFTEGFTNFYSARLRYRAGLISLDEYARDINDAITSYLRSPARDAPNARTSSGGWHDACVRPASRPP